MKSIKKFQKIYFDYLTKAKLAKIIFLCLGLIEITCENGIQNSNGNDQTYYSLSGKIFGEDTNLPLSGVKIELLVNQKSDTTDSLGFYSFDSVLIMNDTIHVFSYGYESILQPIELSVNKTENFYLRTKQPEYTGYRIYCGNSSSDEIFVFDSDKKIICDTLHVKKYITGLRITSDGRYLFVSTDDLDEYLPGSVYLVDLTLNTSIEVFDRNADVFIDPNDQVFFIYSAHNNLYNLNSFDINSHALTFIDTLNLDFSIDNSQNIAFSPNQPIFYTVNNKSELFAYNYLTKEIVKTFEPKIYNFVNMTISNDGTLLFFSGGPVVDIYGDSAITYIGGNFTGSLAFDVWRNRVYQTDYGVFVPPQPIPKGHILIFDVLSFTSIGSIEVGYGNSTDKMVISPDFNYLYTNNVGSIYEIDLREGKLIHEYILSKSNIHIRSLALGLKNVNN